MRFTTPLKMASAFVIAAACLLPGTSFGATLPKQSKVKSVKSPAAKLRSVKIKRIAPRPVVLQGSSAAKAGAAKSKATKSKTTKSNATRSLAPKRLMPPAAAAFARPKIAAKSPRLTALRPQDPNFNDIALRAGRIRANLVDQSVRGLNSSTARALESVMPGLSGRVGKGNLSLRDFGTSGGNHRNPVMSAGGISDFAGGGSGRYSEGGENKKEDLGRGVVKETAADGTVIYHHPDGTTVFVEEDGTTTAVGPGGDILTTKPDGSKEYSTKDEKRTYDSNGTLYSTEKGNQIIFHQERGVSSSEGKSRVIKQCDQKGEPVDDPTGSGGSGRAVVTAETLRGLAARFNGAMTFTGDEATTGGPVDQSKTRQGRVGQVGQPVDDSVGLRGAPTAMEVNQAIRVRMRNITPIPR
jgi:hypothetical protein